MVNLTTVYDKDVNFFLIESGFMKQVLIYIHKMNRSNFQLIELLRANILMLHVNIFSEKTSDLYFITTHLSIIVDDLHYRKNNIGLIFRCLRNASRIEGTWEEISKAEPYIFTNLEDIMSNLRHYTDEEYEEFLDFMNEVMINSDFGLDIYDFMDPELLLKKVKEVHHPFNSKNKVRILKSVEVFSNLVNVHVSIKEFFHTQEEICEFIKMLMNPELVLYPKYGKYCTRSLLKLLRGDKYLLHEMLEQGLLDHLFGLLEQKFNIPLILEVIDLVQKVIEI